MVRERESTSVIKKIIAIVIALVLFFIGLWRYWFIFFTLEDRIRNFEMIYEIFLFVFHVIAIIIALRLYKRPMNISYKLSWTIFILATPLLGTFIYLMVGSGRKIPRKRKKIIQEKLIPMIPKTNVLEELIDKDPVGHKLARGLYNKSRMPIYKNTNVKFFHDTVYKNNDMLEEMKKASRYIFMEYFIFSKGELLNSIIDVLEERGKTGVEIKIIYDSLGSAKFFDRKTKKRLRNIPNLILAEYEKVTLNLNPVINYRDHRKMTVIDGKIAYCGGDNIADEYVHLKKPFGQWRDNAIRLEGEAVDSFILMFATTWYMSTKDTLEVRDYKYKHEVVNTSYVQPFGDGPTEPHDPTYNLFLSLISTANKSICISTPYLIIDMTFIDALIRAAKSGVDVKILTPQNPDKKIVHMMTRFHYGGLLKAGAKVFEYKDGFNHAKNIIIDNQYAYIGTTNVDYRSFFLHFECGVLLFNDHQVKVMNQDFLDTIKVSDEVLFTMWKKRKSRTKFMQFILSIFTPLF